MAKAYHHRNFSFGMNRQGAAHEACDVVSTSDCVTRQMNDEELAHFQSLLSRKRLRRGVALDNPNDQSRGETPHDYYEEHDLF